MPKPKREITPFRRAASFFDKWAKKIGRTLNRAPSETRNRELPGDCRWLMYWGDQLFAIDPESFEGSFRDRMSRLLNESAERLEKDFARYLKIALSKKPGTQARLRELTRYAYYTQNYVLPLYPKTKNHEAVAQLSRPFFELVLPNLAEYRGLEPTETSWMLKFIDRVREAGVETPKGSHQ